MSSYVDLELPVPASSTYYAANSFLLKNRFTLPVTQLLEVCELIKVF